MNLLFVYPNFTRQTTPQVGIASLLALMAKKHRVSLFDLTFVQQGHELTAFEESYTRTKPDAVFISCRSNEWGLVKRYIEMVYPVPAIVGGIHPTVVPEEVIGYARAIVRGEGETVIEEIIDRMESGKSIKSVPGVWLKEGGKVYRNDVPDLIQDLDTLPMPLWRAFNDGHFYRSYIKNLFDDIECVGTFETTRGCPFACTYCCNYTLREIYRGKGTYHRRKSPQRVAGEISAFHEQYPDTNFHYFVDDTFMVDEKWLREFSKLYDKTPFVFMTRAEMVTEKKMDLIKTMNGRAVSIGVESGNEKFRKEVLGRTMSDEQIISAFRIAREHGLRTYSFNMVGMPHETVSLFQSTVDLNKLIKPDKAQFTVFFPFKGTKLYEECVKHGFINGNYPELFNYYNQSFLKMEQFPREEIARCLQEANAVLN